MPCANLVKPLYLGPGNFGLFRFLTHWGRDKMDAISQTTFSSAFSWMKIFEFRWKFHWSLFLRVQLTIFQHWFRYWLGAVQATSHYLNQWWLVYWRIYASLGLNELTYMHKTCIPRQRILYLWHLMRQSRIICLALDFQLLISMSTL